MDQAPSCTMLALLCLLLPVATPFATAIEARPELPAPPSAAPLCVKQEVPPRVDLDNCGPTHAVPVRIILRYATPSGPQELALGCRDDCMLVLVINLATEFGPHVVENLDEKLENDALPFGPAGSDVLRMLEAIFASLASTCMIKECWAPASAA